MAANFPFMNPVGGYGPPPPAKPKPRIDGSSKVCFPHQGPTTIAGVSADPNPINDEQKKFLSRISDYNARKIPELKTEVFTDADKARAFIGDESIQLKGGIVAASTLEVKMNWLKEGQRRVVYRPSDESIWQGFRVDNHEFYQVSGFKHEDIAKLITDSDDEVFIQRYCHDRTDLLAHVMKQMSKMRKVENRYNDVRIPNVKLDRTFVDDTLNGLWFDIDGKKSEIKETINKVKLDMNFRGVEVKSVFYCNIGCYSEIVTDGPVEYTVDRPFIMWIHRKGMDFPYFIGYITEQDWEEIDW